MKIKLLPDAMINLIAAGEIIERPFSALKELVENSIDAGATSIEVEIASGGRKKIVVRDNGFGMNRDDAILSLERHATSKLDNLYSITTFGFRGEALPSIAAVSKMTLKTSDRDDGLGVQIVIEGGVIKSVEDAAVSKGTVIEVLFLFYNQPARRKYLKAARTEQAHIAKFIFSQALVAPGVHFKLSDEKSEIYDFAGVKSKQERCRQVLGDEFIESCIWFEKDPGDFLEISGMVSKPDEEFLGIQEIYVNSRKVNSPLVAKAILSGWEGRPDYLVFIELDPAAVDVNVHPAKKEVRFLDSQSVYSFVRGSILEALASYGKEFFGAGPSVITDLAGSSLSEKCGTAEPVDEEGADPVCCDSSSRTSGFDIDMHHELPKEPAFISPSPLPETGQTAGNGSGSILEELIERPSGVELEPCLDAAAGAENNDAGKVEIGDTRKAVTASNRIFEGVIRPIGQFGGIFLIVEIAGELYIIDQHTAHERILYEELKSSQEGQVASQLLAFPVAVTLLPDQLEQLLDFQEVLGGLGIMFERFSNDSIVVRGLPASTGSGDMKKLVDELVAIICDNSVDDSLSLANRLVVRDNVFRLVACHGAVRANQELEDDEVISLVDRLMKTSSPFKCPHGRPVVIRFTREKLEKMFGRK